MTRYEVYPIFYDSFECKADRCAHSCCRGWEIDVDEDSAAYYATVTDPIGDEIRSALKRDEDGCHFGLTKDMRCPFLRDDGLCRMILALGEEALCDICALHPRFYSDYEKYELCGLGFSCERVCELLWESDERLTFSCDEVDEETGEVKTGAFSFPEQKLSYSPQTDRDHVAELLNVFGKTEPIDEEWTKSLDELRADCDGVIHQALQYKDSYDKKRYDRLFHYIIYRQLGETEDRKALLLYAQRAVDFIFITAAYYGAEKECIRRFSEQIEYSTENVGIIMGG